MAQNDNIVMVLPCEGQPYVLGEFKQSQSGAKSTVDLLKDAVDGDFDSYDMKHVRIHPMFVAEKVRWLVAERAMAKAHIMYVNENGSTDCCINSGTVIVTPAMRLGGCPHLFGNVALVIKRKYLMFILAAMGATYEWLGRKQVLAEEDALFDDEFDECGLCDGTLDCKWGHNPAPLQTNGRNDVCCDSCNATKVIPARMAAMD